MNQKLIAQADRLKNLIAELEKALAHAKVGESHFRAGEVPRGCAHTLALQGHMNESQHMIDEIAKDHRLSANPNL
jgi:hypothetical protein